MFTLTLPQSAVKEFVSTGSIRPETKGVHFNAEKQQLEMTNEHILAVIPHVSTENSIILPVEAFPKTPGSRTIVEHLEGSRLSITEEHPKKGVVSERVVTTIEGKFPNVQAVMDSMPKHYPVEQIAVNPSFFKPFYILDKQTGGIGDVKITFHGKTGGMLIQSNGYEDRYTGILMPVRIR